MDQQNNQYNDQQPYNRQQYGQQYQNNQQQGYQYQYQYQQQQYNPQYQPQYVPQYQTPPPTSGMCIAGFVCSLVLFGILGLVFSIVGINDCNKQGLGGKGLGIAGMIISIIKVCCLILYFTAVGCACSQMGLWSGRW